jgi:hypothetical protein
MSRPLGSIIVWKKNDADPKWQIMKNGLFGYYQNGVDYVNEFARAHGWTSVDGITTNTIAYEKGQYRIELSLVEATGVDLSKETYLFQENVNEETKA